MAKKQATQRNIKIGDWAVEIGSMDNSNPTSIYINIGRYGKANIHIDDAIKFNEKQWLRIKKEVDRLTQLSTNFGSYLVDFMLPSNYSGKRNFIACETTLYRQKGNLSSFEEMLGEAIIMAELMIEYIEAIPEFHFE